MRRIQLIGEAVIFVVASVAGAPAFHLAVAMLERRRHVGLRSMASIPITRR